MDDVITSNGILRAFPSSYHKVDVFHNRRVHWLGQVVGAPTEFQDCIIAGHGDFPITTEIAHAFPARVWWSTNSQSLLVNGYPLGLTNCEGGEIQRLYANTEIMQEANNRPRQIHNRVFMNFSLETHSSRVDVYNKFKDTPWVTNSPQVNTLEGRKVYLQEIRNHEFVLCPRGYGVDTCRLWETLYLGSIPIVQRDIVHRGWLDLPIAWVDSWDEITPEWLDSQLERIRNGTWNMEKLKLSYWIRKIKESTYKDEA